MNGEDTQKLIVCGGMSDYFQHSRCATETISSQMQSVQHITRKTWDSFLGFKFLKRMSPHWA